MDINTLELIKRAIKDHDKELTAINKTIWSNPELGYREDLAHDSICKLFESKVSEGYRVTRSAYGVKTSFRVDFGTGGRLVVLNAEYDALPVIGHACGHNLIATSSIAAFIGVCKALEEKGFTSSATIRLLGTPAEEGGGGKLRLLEQGAYKNVFACLMAHPIQLTQNRPDIRGFASPAPGTFLANDKVQVTFRGKASHASLCPWEGINALDAAVVAYSSISMLRQQVPPTHRIHGVITNGGLRPNVIPEVASMEYYIRAPNAKQLKLLTKRVIECLDGAAKSTGCTVEYIWLDSYLDLRSNESICRLYLSKMELIGGNFLYDDSTVGNPGGGSTDMGNVTYACPGFHTLFGIPAKASIHTREFTDAAGTREAHERCLSVAAGMAAVAYDILTDDDVAARVQDDYDEDVLQR